jgi:hypothetical protein
VSCTPAESADARKARRAHARLTQMDERASGRAAAGTRVKSSANRAAPRSRDLAAMDGASERGG